METSNTFRYLHNRSWPQQCTCALWMCHSSAASLHLAVGTLTCMWHVSKQSHLTLTLWYAHEWIQNLSNRTQCSCGFSKGRPGVLGYWCLCPTSSIIIQWNPGLLCSAFSASLSPLFPDPLTLAHTQDLILPHDMCFINTSSSLRATSSAGQRPRLIFIFYVPWPTV